MANLIAIPGTTSQDGATPANLNCGSDDGIRAGAGSNPAKQSGRLRCEIETTPTTTRSFVTRITKVNWATRLRSDFMFH